MDKKETYEIEFKSYTNKMVDTVDANEIQFKDGFIFFNNRKSNESVYVELMVCAGDVLCVKKK